LPSTPAPKKNARSRGILKPAWCWLKGGD